MEINNFRLVEKIRNLWKAGLSSLTNTVKFEAFWLRRRIRESTHCDAESSISCAIFAARAAGKTRN